LVQKSKALNIKFISTKIMFNHPFSAPAGIATLSLLFLSPAAAILSESPFSRATTFKLVADPLRHDLKPSIQSWEVTSYHISLCYDYAILQDPKSPNSSGARQFYANGTKSHPFYTNILSDGSTSGTPYGLTIARRNETDAIGRRPVRIDCGAGTGGLGVARMAGSGDPHLTDANPTLGWFYACNSTLGSGYAIQLFFASHSFDEKTPADCSVVDLLPQCMVNSTAGPYIQEVDCHKNVSQAFAST
jgi:hypothetical protein